MPILNAINNFKSKVLQFTGRKKTLESISMDELTEQRVLLDRKEEEQLQKIEKLEKQKDDIFDQAKKEKEPRRQERAAAKIASCTREIKHFDAELYRLRKELRLVTGLEHIKRKSERATGAYSQVVAGMSVSELTGLIDQATVDDQLNQEKLDDLLGTMDESLEFTESTGNDDELEKDILSQIRKAQAEEETKKNETNNNFQKEQTPLAQKKEDNL